ncbi:hypothetical protein OF83DRAFT_296950 [Amylostereum chailletii]|nr:hypothetical protein OF83DRAFT_296950 [Amylostereum chailletii]
MLAQLRREDFPLIQHWTRREWKEHDVARKGVSDTEKGKRGPSNLSKGINKTAQFVQHATGVPVSGDYMRKENLLIRGGPS